MSESIFFGFGCFGDTGGGTAVVAVSGKMLEVRGMVMSRARRSHGVARRHPSGWNEGTAALVFLFFPPGTRGGGERRGLGAGRGGRGCWHLQGIYSLERGARRRGAIDPFHLRRHNEREKRGMMLFRSGLDVVCPRLLWSRVPHLRGCEKNKEERLRSH